MSEQERLIEYDEIFGHDHLEGGAVRGDIEVGGEAFKIPSALFSRADSRL
jgi:hypothetical protein